MMQTAAQQVTRTATPYISPAGYRYLLSATRVQWGWRGWVRQMNAEYIGQTAKLYHTREEAIDAAADLVVSWDRANGITC